MEDEFEGGYSDSTIEENDLEEEVVEIIPDDPANNENELAVQLPNVENPRSVELSNQDNVLHDDPASTGGAHVEDDIVLHSDDEDKNTAGSPAKSGKRSRESDSEDENDPRNLCPICMDKWTNAGDHRLVCLKCGHLFGNSCILRWLDIGCPSGQRRCPQCNKKAHKRDIRTLYAYNLQALDTSENVKLQLEITALRQEKTQMEMEIAKVNLSNKMYQEELKQALSKVETLEKKLCGQQTQNSQPVSQPTTVTRMILENTIEISSTGGCRVLTWNSLMHELYVSQGSTNNLFPGYSVRKIGIGECRHVFGQCIYLHTKAIRDLAVRPQSNDLLLSVSLDKTAKLLDLSSNSVINKFNANNPLWSCCWDSSNLNRFFVGSQNGQVTQFDSRQPSTPLQQLAFPGDLSAVTSVVSLPYCAGRAMPQGGILVSKLVSCWAFSQNSSGDEYRGQRLPMEGPFTSLCHDKETDHILVSKRPSVRNPNICHMVCQLDQEESSVVCNVVHSFLGGSAQKQLSRPCFAKVKNEMLVAAYVESTSSIKVWNVSSRQTVAAVKAYDPVKDICSVQCDNRSWFAALSEKSLRIYSMASS